MNDNSNSNDNGSSSTRVGGYSRKKTAYLCYIVKKDGTKATILTTPKVISIGANGDNYGLSQSFYNSTDHSYCTPKLGNKSVQLFNDFDWDIPNPMNGSGQGQSEAIIKWMNGHTMGQGEKGPVNGAGFIVALWDDSKYRKNSKESLWEVYATASKDPNSTVKKFFASTDQYLIMEAVYWMNDYGGTTRIATANGWLKLSKAVSVTENTVMNRFPVYITFKKTQFGLKACPSPHSLTKDQLINDYATGMISLSGEDMGGTKFSYRLGAQSTCNEQNITKAHIAPNESPQMLKGLTYNYDKNGILQSVKISDSSLTPRDYSIVKTYVTKTQYVDKNGKVIKVDKKGNVLTNGAGKELVEYEVDASFKGMLRSMESIRIEDETKESALKHVEIVPMTKTNVKEVGNSVEISYNSNIENYFNKTYDIVNSKKEKNCYSLTQWYVTPGKALKESTIESKVLTEDKDNTRYTDMLKESGKSIIKAGDKETYVNLHSMKDSLGKKGKVLYVLLTKTVQKPYYQSTCDEDYVEKYENNLDKLPHAAPDESNSGNCTIVKTYITKTVSKDTNGVEIGATYKVDKDYLIKDDSISKIDIESETVGGKGKYKLNWYAVTSGKVIPKEKLHPIKSDGSGTQFRYNIETQNGKNIVYRGDTPGTITLDKHEKNGAKGKILYVYLMREIELVNTTKNESKSSEHKAPKESEGQCAVVKCYREIDADTDEITGVATYTTKDVANAIWIENEDTPTGKVVKNNTVETVNNSKMSGYRVVAYKSTDTILNLSSLGMTGAEFAGMEDWYNKVPGKRLEGVDGTTIVDGGKKLHIKPGACLYILLEKEINGITGDFTITQSSLTKRVHLSEAAATANIVTHNFRWTAPSISKTSCSGHKWSHSPGCRGGYWVGSGEDSYYVYPWCPIHTDYCSGWQWVDDSITLQLDNTKKNSYPDIIIGTNKINWQTITSYRQLNLRRDYLTRYSTGSDTKTLNNYDYAMVLWRGKDKLTVAEWKNSSSVNSLMKQIGFFVGNTPKGTRKTSEYLESFQTLFSCVSPDRNTRYTATISAPNSGGLCSVPTSTYQFNTGTQLKQSATVDVETYSGKDGGAENNKLTTGNGLIEAGTITFYPYIKMKYDKLDTKYTTNTSQTAYVLGQYKRKITFYDLAEVMFKEDTTGNIQVDSNQWSTHKQINDKLESVLDADTTSLDKHMILPGGTTYWVSNIAYKSDGSIDKKTHQVVTIRTFQTYLASDGKTQITKTNGSSTLKSKTNAVNANKEFVESVEKAFKKLRLVQWVNTNPKKDPFKGQIVYSGDTFGGNTLSSDKKYYFNNGKDVYLDTHIDASKTSQKEYTFKADAEGNILMNGTVILSLGELASDISDPTAKLINNKTGIVSQLREGLEHNVGRDKTAKWASSSGKWYNEAFDGVTVLVTTTTMNVGFWNPTERQTVSDPALTPVQGDKSEIGSQFWVTQMKTRQYSDFYGESNPNQVGVFKGLKIYVNDLSKFMISKKWYIPNVTSQDLK